MKNKNQFIMIVVCFSCFACSSKSNEKDYSNFINECTLLRGNEVEVYENGDDISSLLDAQICVEKKDNLEDIKKSGWMKTDEKVSLTVSVSADLKGDFTIDMSKANILILYGFNENGVLNEDILYDAMDNAISTYTTLPVFFGSIKEKEGKVARVCFVGWFEEYKNGDTSIYLPMQQNGEWSGSFVVRYM